MQLIEKRDGRIVPFDKNKIITAVTRAFVDVDGEETTYAVDKAKSIAKYISEIESDDIMDVERIQDIVEEKLMACQRKDVAKAYIIYRNSRTKKREANSFLLKNVAEKLMANNVQNQNANVDEKSFGGRMGESNSVVMKQYALNYCMSDLARNNHINNEIYIHDLDQYSVGSHNCLTIPFDDLLANGFQTRQTDVRPANSVNTAFQLLAVIFQLQSLQQFGGVSASHLDWTMIPYVRKSFYKHYCDGLKYCSKWNDELIQAELTNMNDMNNYIHMSINDTVFYRCADAYEYAMDMTVKETQQAVEGMYHNLNY